MPGLFDFFFQTGRIFSGLPVAEFDPDVRVHIKKGGGEQEREKLKNIQMLAANFSKQLNIPVFMTSLISLRNRITEKMNLTEDALHSLCNRIVRAAERIITKQKGIIEMGEKGPSRSQFTRKVLTILNTALTEHRVHPETIAEISDALSEDTIRKIHEMGKRQKAPKNRSHPTHLILHLILQARRLGIPEDQSKFLILETLEYYANSGAQFDPELLTHISKLPREHREDRATLIQQSLAMALHPAGGKDSAEAYHFLTKIPEENRKTVFENVLFLSQQVNGMDFESALEIVNEVKNPNEIRSAINIALCLYNRNQNFELVKKQLLRLVKSSEEHIDSQARRNVAIDYLYNLTEETRDEILDILMENDDENLFDAVLCLISFPARFRAIPLKDRCEFIRDLPIDLRPEVLNLMKSDAEWTAEKQRSLNGLISNFPEGMSPEGKLSVIRSFFEREGDDGDDILVGEGDIPDRVIAPPAAGPAAAQIEQPIEGQMDDDIEYLN